MDVHHIRAVSIISIVSLTLGLIGCAAPQHEPRTAVGFAKLNGHPVYYESHGSGDVAIVLIHGWCCDHTIWTKQIDALAQQHRVIALDLPGHGLSEKPKIDYTVDFFAEAVRQVLEHAAVNRAVLVGHSLGAAVAWEFTRDTPDRVAGFVSVDGVLMRVPRQPDARDEWQESVNRFAARFHGPELAENRNAFFQSLFGDNLPAGTQHEILTVVRRTPDHVAASAMAGVTDPAVYREQQIDVPTLVLFAEWEEVNEATEIWLRSFFSDLQFEVWRNIGHFPMLEAPNRFNQRILTFTHNALSTAE